MSIATKAHLAVILAVVAAATGARAQDVLAFTVKTDAETRSGIGANLHVVTREDVVQVRPAAGLPFSAEKFAPLMMWNALLGDEDGDGSYYEPVLAVEIDAIGVPCPSSARFDQLDMVVSTNTTIGYAGCGRDILWGDLVFIRPNGAVDYFLTEAMIRDALGIPAAEAANVDALEFLADRSILLSFDDNLHVGATLLEDGGIALLPAAGLVYADCVVAAVAPLSGSILASEATVNGWVANAMAANVFGDPVTVIEDLDGLDLDPAGGTILIQEQGHPPFLCPNLMFCGKQLTGGGVLSTVGGGSIALLNGVLLATPADALKTPTTGEQVGLLAFSVSGLNALQVAHDASIRFVLDTPTPLVAPGDIISVEFGGADGLSPVLLGFALGPAGPCGVAAAVSAATAGFPAFYPPLLFLPPLLSGPLGAGAVSGPYPGGLPAGSTIVFQALTLKGPSLALSTPLLLQF